MNLQTRIERLETTTKADPDVLIVVGEPNAQQQSIIDAGTARIVIQIPGNGRGDHGQHSEPH